MMFRLSRAFDPDWVVPTALLLAEEFEYRGLSAHSATFTLLDAERPRAEQMLKAILDDEPLTDDAADLLERITGVSKQFWAAFEHNYRVGLAAGKTVVR